LTKKIKPLHIGKFFPPPYAGIEGHVDTLLRCISPEAEPTLLAAEASATAVRATEQNLPYKIIVAKSYGKMASAMISPGVVLISTQHLRCGLSNLLHIHAPNPWGDLAALAINKKLPVVMTWHSDIIRQKKLLIFYKHIQKAALNRVNRIVLPTPLHYQSSTQLSIERLNLEHKFKVVPYGIDFSVFHGDIQGLPVVNQIKDFALDRPVLLSVGRHVSYKGYEYLLKAMSLVGPNVCLVLVGSGPLTTKLMSIAREHNLTNRVLFLGSVDLPNLIGAYKCCDLFTLPSIERAEAFGIASVEAMYCGKPTIVCDLGNGVNFVNKRGFTSLVVPPRDGHALAEAIELLAGDAKLRAQMGLEAKKWVESQFNLKLMKEGMLSLYREIL
jgi:glycosyltransferase involved in cell wall biosynthesis